MNALIVCNFNLLYRGRKGCKLSMKVQIINIFGLYKHKATTAIIQFFVVTIKQPVMINLKINVAIFQ